MIIDSKKLDRQLTAINKWVNSKDYGSYANGIGTFHWCVGTGKTYAALLICKRLLKKNPTARIIIIVPSEYLQKQWIEEIKENIEEYLWVSIEIYTIHYLVSNSLKIKCELLVVDEIHEMVTEDRLKYLNKTNIEYQFILGLTATWEDKEHRERFLKPICPVIDTIDEKEALEKGFIQKYIEYNLAAKFTDEERLEYKAHSEVIAKHFPKFANNLEIAQQCLVGGVHTDGKKYSGFGFSNGWARRNGWEPGGSQDDSEYARIDDLWNPNKIIGYAKALMFSIRERKEILYNCVDKAYQTVKIIQKYPTLKTICFAQSTRFADKVGFLINQYDTDSCAIYHSKLETISRLDEKGKVKKIGKTVLRREAIEAIRSGKAKRISTASALDRGFNVVDIRMGITTSGTQNPTQHTQRKGRSVRLEIYAPDVVVLLINVYIPNTVDEKWLRKRQAKSSNIIHWVNSVEEIDYNPIDSEIIDSSLI